MILRNTFHFKLFQINNKRWFPRQHTKLFTNTTQSEHVTYTMLLRSVTPVLTTWYGQLTFLVNIFIIFAIRNVNKKLWKTKNSIEVNSSGWNLNSTKIVSSCLFSNGVIFQTRTMSRGPGKMHNYQFKCAQLKASCQWIQKAPSGFQLSS